MIMCKIVEGSYCWDLTTLTLRSCQSFISCRSVQRICCRVRFVLFSLQAILSRWPGAHIVHTPFDTNPSADRTYAIDINSVRRYYDRRSCRGRVWFWYQRWCSNTSKRSRVLNFLLIILSTAEVTQGRRQKRSRARTAATQQVPDSPGMSRTWVTNSEHLPQREGEEALIPDHHKLSHLPRISRQLCSPLFSLAIWSNYKYEDCALAKIHSR